MEYVKKLSNNDPNVLMPRDAAYVRQLIRESIRRTQELPKNSDAAELPVEEALYRWLWDMYRLDSEQYTRNIESKTYTRANGSVDTKTYYAEIYKAKGELLEAMKEKRSMQEKL